MYQSSLKSIVGTRSGTECESTPRQQNGFNHCTAQERPEQAVLSDGRVFNTSKTAVLSSCSGLCAFCALVAGGGTQMCGKISSTNEKKRETADLECPENLHKHQKLES